jgi:site-specific recombinase XerD
MDLVSNKEPGGLLKNNLVIIPEESIWLSNFISKDTQKTYKNAVLNFLQYRKIQNLDQLRLIDQSSILAWRDHLITSKASNRTVNNRMAALSSLFNHLCEKQIVTTNPVKGLKRPKVNQASIKTPALTVEQVRIILNSPNKNTVKGLRDWALLHVLFYTGCREGALHKLKVGSFYERSGYFVLDINEKGDKENIVAIHHELQASLREYLARVEHSKDMDSPMFIGVKNKKARLPLATSSIRDIFKSYLNKCNIPNYEKYSVHSARATFITEALRNNCPVENVQQTVTHANISTTLMYDTRKQEAKNSASFKVEF